MADRSTTGQLQNQTISPIAIIMGIHDLGDVFQIGRDDCVSWLRSPITIVRITATASEASVNFRPLPHLISCRKTGKPFINKLLNLFEIDLSTAVKSQLGDLRSRFNRNKDKSQVGLSTNYHNHSALNSSQPLRNFKALEGTHGSY